MNSFYLFHRNSPKTYSLGNKLNEYPILLSLIFHFLNIKDILVHIRVCCKQWNSSTNHPLVWINKEIGIIHSKEILQTNKDFPFLTSLYLLATNYSSERSHFGNLNYFSTSFTSWKYLTNLTIADTTISSLQGIEGLKNTLTSLEIKDTYIEDQNFLPITELVNLKKLKWEQEGSWFERMFEHFIQQKPYRIIQKNSKHVKSIISIDKYPFEKFPGYKLTSLIELELKGVANCLLPGFCAPENHTYTKLPLIILSLIHSEYFHENDLSYILRNVNFKSIRKLEIQDTYDDLACSIDSDFLNSFHYLEYVSFMHSSFSDSKLALQLLIQNNYQSLQYAFLFHIGLDFTEDTKLFFKLNVIKICEHLNSLQFKSKVELQNEIQKFILD